jgi:hypothetical protein
MMMTRYFKQCGSSAVIVLMLGSVAATYAQGSGSRVPYPQPNPGPSRFPSEPSRELIKVTVEGEHVGLEENAGSRTKSVKVIPTHGFKVLRAVNKNGEELAGLRGTVLRYQETRKSKNLILDRPDGQKLVIKGKLDPRENVLEVDSVELVEAEGRDVKKQGSGSR